MNKWLPVVIRAASLWGHNLGEEWFIWAHGFREFSSWSFGSLFLGLSWGRSPDGRTILREILFTLVWTQSVVRIGLRNTSFSDTSPSNPFPQIKAHLVKFCVSPEITLLAVDSNHRGILYSNPTTSQRPYLSILSLWWLNFQHTEFGQVYQNHNTKRMSNSRQMY